MTKEKEKKVGKDQLLLEAARLGRAQQLDTILSQMQQLKSKKKSNPLASLRKTIGPNSVRDPVTGFTCLHHASLNGHSECVKLILDYGAKLNAVDYKGSAALHLAAWAGNLEVVKILLDHGTAATDAARPSSASPTACNVERSGEAAANSKSSTDQQHHHQPHSKQREQQQQLIDVDLCNNDNQTPLSLAAQFGHCQVVAELLAHGASVHLRNSQLESPLDLACLNGRLETVDLLLKSAPGLVAELRRPRSSLMLQSAGNNNNNHNNTSSTCNSTSDPSSIRPLSVSLDSPTQSSRRPSGAGGWSSLLKGRRDSSATTTTSGTANNNNNPNHQSPLHRFAVGTLSMRQGKSQVNSSSQESGSPNSSSSTTNQQQPMDAKYRRATLSMVGGAGSISAPNAAAAGREHCLRQQQQQLGKQLSADWVSVAQSGDSDERQQQQDIEAAGFIEKLLPHSPLHYATRRGHVDVINLLLSNHQANILQVSSLGGVLHEIALNNGKHGDIIGLFFSYIGGAGENSSSSSASKQETLNKFLGLKNAQGKSVFEVLNEMNNRSAQELRRLIYEFSEQVQFQCEAAAANSSTGNTINDGTNNNNNNNGAQHKATQNTRQQQQQQLLLQQQFGNSNSNQNFSSQQFSDIHQINSFVTMKRVPKNHHQQHQQQQQQLHHHRHAPQGSLPLEDATAKHLNHEQQHATGADFGAPSLATYGTQTIDRKGPSSAARQHLQQQQQQPWNAGGQLAPLQQLHHPAFGAGGHFSLNQQQQQPSPLQHMQFFGGQPYHMPTMTRSVSNLNRTSMTAEQQFASDNSELMWRQWLMCGRPATMLNSDSSGTATGQEPALPGFYPSQQQQHQQRRRRSKSRDLGSLLMEARARGSGQVSSDESGEHLYDNSATGSPFENVPTAAGEPLPISGGGASAHQLVRSQTDCSHLMGRFFGDHVDSAPLMNQHQQQMPMQQAANLNQQKQQQHQQQQQHNRQGSIIDRKMINRHYHVYDHEFYPPRLLGQAPADALFHKQPSHSMMMGVSGGGGGGSVLPMARNESGSLRSSIRSTSSSQSTVGGNNNNSKKQRQPVGGPRQVSSARTTTVADNNSRLSLNVDAQMCGNRFATESSTATLQQQHQMDRFLGRHSSRKSGAAGPAPPPSSSVDLGTANDADWDRASLISADQKRQELVELQRRLVAEQSVNQQQSIQSSCSLESHLSEPHLFESTRQALMHDFDQMIGRELLNRNHRQIIDGGLLLNQKQQQQPSGLQPSSLGSHLTGVMLDMDGHQLTVSGTRVTPMAAAQSIGRDSTTTTMTGTTKCTQAKLPKVNRTTSGSHRPTSNGSSSVDVGPPADSSPNLSIGTASSKTSHHSHSTTTHHHQFHPATKHSSRVDDDDERANNDQDADDDDPDDLNYPSVAPPKPPRLSLMNKQPIRQKVTTSQKMSPSLQRAVIYDLPATRDVSGGEGGAAGLDSMQCPPPTRPREPLRSCINKQVSVDHATTGPFSGAKISRASLTEPPKERPPPPPQQRQKPVAETSGSSTSFLSTPLHVVAPPPPNDHHSSTATNCSFNSSSSTGSSNAATEPAGGLLKMASITSAGSMSTSSSQSSSSVSATTAASRRPPSTTAGGRHHVVNQHSSAEPDSGVCTSNSPASMSHDSEGPSTDPHCVEMMSSSSSAYSKEKKPNEPKSSAVIRHSSLTRRTSTPNPHPGEPTPTVDQSAETNNLVHSNVAPPSPNTAQQCIEEALMPLAKPASRSIETANRSTSPPLNGSSRCASTYSMDRWLVAAADFDSGSGTDLLTTAVASPNRPQPENEHYENCLALQRRLRGGGLLRPAAKGDCEEEGDDEDDDGDDKPLAVPPTTTMQMTGDDEEEEDYAESANENHLAGSTESSADSSRADEKHGDDEDDDIGDNDVGRQTDESPVEGPEQQQQQQRRKEVMLKVVIDEGALSSQADGDVFFINPLELKRFATKRRSQIDAETLTDEELCAAVDKSSGYIRFTLRKRRNNQCGSNNDADIASSTTTTMATSKNESTTMDYSPSSSQLPTDSYAAATIGSSGETLHPVMMKDLACERQELQLSSAKKSKLHNSSTMTMTATTMATTPTSETTSTSVQLPPQSQTRRHSEMVATPASKTPNQHLTGSALGRSSKSGVAGSLETMTIEPPETCSRLPHCSSEGPTGEASSHQQSTRGQPLAVVNKQGAIELRQWFATKLVGLAEYLGKFLEHGLDNVHFLNHPALINDQLLRQIGIDDESHRLLIVERISEELEPVNFRNLFKVGALLFAPVKVLELLEMSHVIEEEQNPETLPSEQLESCQQLVNWLREKSRNLPIGYAARLSAAADFMSEELADQRAAELVTKSSGMGQISEPAPESSSVAATESMELETSPQASVSTSSSSKDSIRSILSMKASTTMDALSAGQENGPGEEANPTNGKGAAGGNVDEPTSLVGETPPKEATEQPVARTGAEPAAMVLDQRKPERPIGRRVAAGTGSLVSEAARKLEAAVSAQKGGQQCVLGGGANHPPVPQRPPVAAARRFSGPRNVQGPVTATTTAETTAAAASVQATGPAASIGARWSRQTDQRAVGASKQENATDNNQTTTTTINSCTKTVSPKSSPKRPPIVGGGHAATKTATTTTASVQVKSLCWPPPKAAGQQQPQTTKVNESKQPTLTTAAPACTSSTRLQQAGELPFKLGGQQRRQQVSVEQQQQQQQPQPQKQVQQLAQAKLRPKPEPPAKPAKLAASRLQAA